MALGFGSSGRVMSQRIGPGRHLNHEQLTPGVLAFTWSGSPSDAGVVGWLAPQKGERKKHSPTLEGKSTYPCIHLCTGWCAIPIMQFQGSLGKTKAALHGADVRRETASSRQHLEPGCHRKEGRKYNICSSRLGLIRWYTTESYIHTTDGSCQLPSIWYLRVTLATLHVPWNSPSILPLEQR